MKNAKKTIIVTGGAGFIGGNFVHYMLRTHPDYRIICLDCLTYAGNLETLASVMTNPNFRFVKESISDRKAVYDLFEAEHPDLVINFAAESHVDRSIENPSIFLETNVMGTQVLLDACRKYGNIRYHQVSTDEVYGDLPLDRPDLFFTETSPIHTSSPYSASKAASDHLVRAFHETYGLPVLLTNCSNNYGPRQFPEKLIPLMVLNGLAGRPLPVYGQGSNVRDWLHVEDHCAAVFRVLEAARPGASYNIGGRAERSNMEVVRAVCALLDELAPTATPHAELIRFVTDRPGHDFRYAMNCAKLERDLGWKPQHDFTSGLRATVRWYLDNADWVKHVQSGAYRQWLAVNYAGRGVAPDSTGAASPGAEGAVPARATQGGAS